MDPEELKIVVDSLFTRASAIILSYGGIVEKFMGDEVLALFGIDRAHEDDSIRALKAAQEIHHWAEGMDHLHGLPACTRIRMHTGINAGMVLVEHGSSLTSEHGALGIPISVASRLCEHAQAGEILIGEALKDDASRFFMLEDQGSHVLKGFRHAQRIWKVVSQRKIPFVLHRNGGGVSSMVGREQELNMLAGILGRGTGNLVSIIGEAGIGKSRLIEEFRTNLPGNIGFHYAACLDHARDTPYFPVRLIITSLLNPGDEPVREEVLMEHISVLPLKGEFHQCLQFLCGDHPGTKSLSPDTWKATVSDAFFHLVRHVSERHPLVICIEDVHWADRTSLDVLEYLGHMVPKMHGTLVIVSHRPGIRVSRPGVSINLKELSRKEISELTCKMTRTDDLPESMKEYLYRESGGNPFYLEEIIHYFLDRGISLHEPVPPQDKLDLPPTIVGLLASRIDGLTEDSQCVLREASVIGKNFSKDLIASISSSRNCLDDCLDELQDTGFIERHDARSYSFRHSLTRRVSYRSMLKKTRVELHRNVALALEERSGNQKTHMADILAHHFFHGQEYASAKQYSLLAARTYQRDGSWVEATKHYLTAMKCIEGCSGQKKDPRELEEVWEGVWNCSRIFQPATALNALESLAGHYRDQGMRKDEVFTYIRLINLYSQRGRFDRAQENYRKAMRLSRGNPEMTAAAQTTYAYTCTFLGKPTVALGYLARSRKKTADRDGFLPAVNSLTTLTSYVWKASIKDAFRWYHRSKELTTPYKDLELMADLLLGYLSFLTGDFVQAERIFRHIRTEERKLGTLSGGLSYLRIQSSVFFNSRYMGNLKQAKKDRASFDARYGDMEGSAALSGLYRAWINLEEGKLLKAKDLLESSLPQLRDGIANRVPYALNALAETYLCLGELQLADRYASESIAWNRVRGNKDQLLTASRVMSRICVRTGDFERASQCLMENSRILHANRMKPHLAWDLSAWGDLYRAAGNIDRARSCFRASLNFWTEMGNPYQVGKVNAMKVLVNS